MPRPKHVDALHVHSFTDLVNMIAERTAMLKTEVRSVLSALREVVIEQVSTGNAIRWHRFGIFLPVLRYSVTNKGTPTSCQIGMAFYPSLRLHNLEAKVDVQELLQRGYSGYRYR